MPGFKAPTMSRVGRSVVAAVVALGGVAAGVALALTVGAAHTTPKHAAAPPDTLLAIRAPRPASRSRTRTARRSRWQRRKGTSCS